MIIDHYDDDDDDNDVLGGFHLFEKSIYPPSSVCLTHPSAVWSVCRKLIRCKISHLLGIRTTRALCYTVVYKYKYKYEYVALYVVLYVALYVVNVAVVDVAGGKLVLWIAMRAEPGVVIPVIAHLLFCPARIIHALLVWYFFASLSCSSLTSFI